MLPAESRVRRREDFTATVRHGRRAGTHGLVVHVSSDHGTGPARAGFIVGRAVGNAVTRNRLRRRLRHLIAPRLADLPAGTLVVVRATAAAASATSHDLAPTLDALLTRALGRRDPRPSVGAS
jgi:ribonuclease P protein component